MAGFTTEPESTSKNGLHNSRQELAVKVLLEAGLPVMTWPGTCGKPDLPPEVIADAESHPIALQERRSRFFLPVHGCIQPGEYEQ